MTIRNVFLHQTLANKRTSIRVYGALCAVGLMFASLSVQAQEKPAPVKVTIHTMAFAQGTWIENSNRRALEGQTDTFTYPRFWDIGAFGALLLDIQVTGQPYWSIETGFIPSYDNGSGEIGINAVEFGQWSTHLPLMLKLRAPARHNPGEFYFMPVAGFGIEAVFPGTPELSSDADEVSSVKADPYLLALVMFGSEFRFPIKDAGELALRFDLLRVGINTRVITGDRRLFEEKDGKVVLISEFDLHASVGMGLGWMF